MLSVVNVCCRYRVVIDYCLPVRPRSGALGMRVKCGCDGYVFVGYSCFEVRVGVSGSVGFAFSGVFPIFPLILALGGGAPRWWGFEGW